MLKSWLTALFAENGIRCSGTPHAPAPTSPGTGELSLWYWHGRTIPHQGRNCQKTKKPEENEANWGQLGLLRAPTLAQVGKISKFAPPRVDAFMAMALWVLGNLLATFGTETRARFGAMWRQR